MSDTLITLENVSLKAKKGALLTDVNLSILQGENIHISGESGSGKTILAKLICGLLLPTEGTVLLHIDKEDVVFAQAQPWTEIGQQSLSYFEKRFEVFIEDKIVTVNDHIKGLPIAQSLIVLEFLKKFDLEYTFMKQVYQLSTGEQKLLQLGFAMSAFPKLMVIDQPFIGVDKANREKLSLMIQDFATHGITWVILGKIPPFSSDRKLKTVYLENGKLGHRSTVDFPDSKIIRPTGDFYLPKPKHFQYLVKMKNVSINYGGTVILKNITWEVLAGERWVVQGPNGSGKSMLISLITGDNPKAYGKDIILFDRKRGSGESIWDIKNNIGYLSPEMHQYFLKGESNVQKILFGHVQVLDDRFTSKITCKDVVASGLTDRVGVETEIYDPKMIAQLFELMELEDMMNLPFATLSMGKQRMVLLMRAIVKMPPLVILDEPCQGLDDHQIFIFKTAIESICASSDMAIIYISHHEEDIPSSMNKFLSIEKGKITAVTHQPS